MKTFNKIIMTIALVAYFAPFSSGQSPKVKRIYDRFCVFDYGGVMVFIKEAPDQVSVGGSICGDVTIPNQIVAEGNIYSVTSIGNGAFEGCTSLTSITIPSSVTSIGCNAFNGCMGLTSITIPNSVTSIGGGAFGGCMSLTSVTIPNSVTSIGGGLTFEGFDRVTFEGCISIPNSVTNIEPGRLSSKKIVVSEGNKKYDSRNNCNAVIETASNTLIATCKNTKIPNSVTSIGDDAFHGCTGLTSIIIPNSVTSIGNWAFEGCKSLTSITIPNSVTSIGSNAFSYCTGLTSVTISSSVTSIGDGAFHGCTGLTSIIIPNSVTSIGDWAFEGCKSLTSITIPNSVTSIGERAFQDCTSLISITIPSSVTSIGDGAFDGCTGLTSVTIENSYLQDNIDYDKVFRGCDKLQRSKIVKSHDTSKTEKTYDTNQSAIKTTTFQYQSDIMAYLRSHKFEASNGDQLTFTNSSIKGSAEIAVTYYEVVNWDSEKALISVHTAYSTTLTIYVYATKGYIVNDDVIWFAK